jgi:hypothetical protein
MSQQREMIRDYFRQHYHRPSGSPAIDAFLDTVKIEEAGGIAVDLCAMRIVNYLRNEGKDLTPTQQFQAIEPIIRQTVSLIMSIQKERDSEPLE